MSMINYGDPTITVWEVDNNGDKVSVPILNEKKQVIGNKIVLEGLPDEQYRVFIDGFVEVNIKDKITLPNQFKVDYRKNGIVFVHESLDGNWLTVGKYNSRGLIFLPASRIWTKIDDFGNVIETLGQVIENLDNILEASDYAQLIMEITALNSRFDAIITTPAGSVTAQEIIDARQGKASLGANLTSIKNDLVAHKEDLVQYKIYAESRLTKVPWISGGNADLDQVWDEGNYMVGTSVLNNYFGRPSYLTVNKFKQHQTANDITIKQTLTRAQEGSPTIRTAYRVLRVNEPSNSVLWIRGWVEIDKDPLDEYMITIGDTWEV